MTRRGRVPGALVAAVLAVACGGRIAKTEAQYDSPLFKSGARLRAHVEDAGGGAFRFVAWHDTALDADCRFATASDGVLRCLPTGDGIDEVFADAACTERATIVSAAYACPEAAAAYTFDRGAPGACGAITSGAAYRIGAAIDGATQYFARSGDACVAQSLDGAALHRVDAVDVTAFVAATSADEPRTERLAAIVWTAADGARQVVGVRDRRVGAECAPAGGAVADPSDLRCAPASVAWKAGRFFADASCTTQVAYSIAGCAPRAILSDDEIGQDGCIAVGIYDLADRATGAYGTDTGTCAPDSTAGHEYWHIGPRAADDAYVTLGELRVGAGNVEARLLADDRGAPIVAMDVGFSSFRDVGTGADCRVVRFGGTKRCVPSWDLLTFDAPQTFADAACAEPLVDTTRGSCVRGAPSRVLALGKVCDEPKLYALGDPYDASTVYSNANGGCAAQPRDFTRTYARLGAAIDPSTLPAIADVVE